MTIRVGVVLGHGLGHGSVPGPGERRLLAWLASSSRVTLAFTTSANAPDPTLPRAVRLLMALERRVLGAPDAAPQHRPDIVSFAGAKARPCDVIVDFSHGKAALALADKARNGLWRLTAFSDAAGLAEARDRAPVTCVALMSHSPGQPPQPLALARYDTKFLATRNAAFIREKSVQMIINALARLALTGAAGTDVIPPPAPRRFVTRDLPGYILRTIGKLTLRAGRKLRERLGGRPGMFLLRLGDGDALDFDPGASKELTPPRGTFWADPFLFEHEGALYLFYEEYDYKARLGHLSVGRLEGDTLVPLGIVLKRPYHLSFPFVFRWGSDILMIPETHEAQRTEVWRATNFPTEWELVSTALEGTGTADTVVFEKDGKWWLFTNICQDSFNDFTSELHLYRIDSPMLNEVTPHPLNPVVIDAATARGAGRVFARDGRLYRMSQDNSHGIYGFGLNLMEITALDEQRYSERRLRHVLPDFDPDIMGCHHLDFAGGRVVFDVRRRFRGAPDLRRR